MPCIIPAYRNKESVLCIRYDTREQQNDTKQREYCCRHEDLMQQDILWVSSTSVRLQASTCLYVMIGLQKSRRSLLLSYHKCRPASYSRLQPAPKVPLLCGAVYVRGSHPPLAHVENNNSHGVEAGSLPYPHNYILTCATPSRTPAHHTSAADRSPHHSCTLCSRRSSPPPRTRGNTTTPRRAPLAGAG